MLGLLPLQALPSADSYLDGEGTPVARRDGDRLVWLVPPPWPAPDDPRPTVPVTIAVAGQLPAPNAGDVAQKLVLVPTGGLRTDDDRAMRWAAAWRAAGKASVDVPLTPTDAAHRRDELAARYSSGPVVTFETVPQLRGPGCTVFFTGLSGSGKSTIARALAQRLAGHRTVTLLDGDVVRTHLSKGLGFDREGRDTNIRRIGWVAAEVTKHGGLAICAPIAPYDEARRWVRSTVERAGGEGSFVLVWVATPLEVCEARDVKGLYAKARSGALTGFTGVDDPYEEPADADLVVDTSTSAVDDAVDRVLDLLGSAAFDAS
jgi:sulfate adenylyltransferase